MRRVFLYLTMFSLFISSLLLSSCTLPSGEINLNQENIKYTVSDFCPFKGDYKITYSAKGSSIADRSVYIDYIRDNRIQLRIVTPTTTIGEVLEVKNGELRLITSRNDFYYRDDMTSYVNQEPEVLLKEPIEKGTSWTLSDGSKRYISGINVDTKTPLGDFKALEVTTQYQNSTVYDYYVLNLGPVKTVYKSKDSTIETAVDRVENNARVNQTIKFYYPDYYSSSLVYVKSKISLKTNDSIKDVIEENFKTSPGGKIPEIISGSTKINNLFFNNPEHKVYIDFSKDFTTWIKQNSVYEKNILQSITNTLGDYYNVDKVYITVEGNPYSSAAVQMDGSSAFYVDYKNIKEFK